MWGKSRTNAKVKVENMLEEGENVNLNKIRKDVRNIKISKVAVFVPSSNASAKDIKRTLRKLEKMEIEVLLSPLTQEIIRKNVKRPIFCYPYSTQQKRYDDFVWAVEQNPDIIVALTGGNGAGELLPFVKKDLKYFKGKSIILLGFSDSTVLVNLWAFLGNPAFIGPCFEDTEDLAVAIRELEKRDKFSFSFRSAVLGEFSGERAKHQVGIQAEKMQGVWGGNLGSFISFLISNLESDGKTPKDVVKGNPIFVFEEIFEGYNKYGTEFTFDWMTELLLTSGILEKSCLALGKIYKPQDVDKEYFKDILIKRANGLIIFDIGLSHSVMDDILIPIGYNAEAEISFDKKKVIFKANLKGKEV